jgi:ferredoxin
MANPSKLRVSVIKEQCIGDGQCAKVAPRTFRLGADGWSSVVAQPEDTREAVLEAALECRMDAICVEDAETGEKLAPGK